VWPLLDQARSMAEREGELQYAVPVAVARAEVAWLEGRPAAIRDETEPIFSRAMAKGAWWQMGELVRWRSRAGLVDEIDPRVPDRYRAEINRDWAKAAGLWSALGCEYDAALALAGADDDELLRQSLLKLQRLGAEAAAAVVARRLRARGARGISRGPRSATKQNPAYLTVRELEVLDLVNSGMRNAEIASRLFLTPKTVDHHVSAILRKLSVETRGQAAKEATRLGLLN
jgi:DNA-binding CsgD family transcriptional regulator